MTIYDTIITVKWFLDEGVYAKYASIDAFFY